MKLLLILLVGLTIAFVINNDNEANKKGKSSSLINNNNVNTRILRNFRKAPRRQ